MHLLDPVKCHQSIRDWLKLYSKQSGTSSISNGSQGMRFVEIADRRANFRKERLKEIFPNAILHEISGTNLRGLSQVEEVYDTILISVDDIQRLRVALNPCGKLLINNKISFAYTSNASCLERARLLRMGFDDVFTNKTSEEEIIIRIESIKRRYADVNNAIEGENELKNFLLRFSLKPLCGRQLSIFYNLIKNCGKVVRYNDLASYDFLEGAYRLESLRVNISQMRKILRGCEIIGIPNEGYLLNVTESANLEKRHLRPEVGGLRGLPAANYSGWPVVSSVRKKSRGLHSSIVYPIALEAVQRLDALFDIERGTNCKRPAERLTVRPELRALLLAQLRTWLTAQVTKLSRGQDLTKAYFYMLKRRSGSRRGLHRTDTIVCHLLSRNGSA